MQRNPTLAILLVLGLCVWGLPARADFTSRLATMWGASEDIRTPMGLTIHPAAKPLGDIRFLDAHNNVMHLSDFKGRLVLVNLWATWCPPCRLEMPSLDKLQETLGKDGLSVVAVSMDKNNPLLVSNFYRENQITTLPIFYDPEWELRRAFMVQGVPASILIGRDGWEIGRATGWLNWSAPETVVFMRNLLQSPAN